MMARTIMGALVAGAMGAAPAFADVFATNIVEQLEQQGFKSISRERTWLGRTRIVAESDDGQREIIVNPNNGEILRDLWLVERRNGGESEREERRAGAGGESAAATPSAGGQDGAAGGKPAATGDETGKQPTSGGNGGGDGGGEKPAAEAGGDGSAKDDGKTEKPKEQGWSKDGKSGGHDWDKSGDEGDKTGGWDGKDTGDVKK